MAKGKEAAVPAIVDSVEALEAKMQAMREAQRKVCSLHTGAGRQDFYEAAMAANKQRIPLQNGGRGNTQRYCGG